MGKKARKLRSPKYAKKASALRETFARLQGKTNIIEDITLTEEIKTTESNNVTITEPVATITEPVATITEPVITEIEATTNTETSTSVNGLKAAVPKTIKKTTTKANTATRRKRATKTKATTKTTTSDI